jgi:hypothetical protein
MTITIIAIIAALLLGMLLKTYFKKIWEFVWCLTIGPWYLFFSSWGASTGNNAGAMGALLGLVGILCQVGVLLFATGVYLIYYFFIR